MVGALDGITVLDLTRVVAGPWASQNLADLGATVIKIERPGEGDDTRHWGPPYADNGMAAYFLAVNRGKQSVTVDIAHPAGCAIVQQLAREADVVLENFKHGGLAKYGLDYASLSELNPRLVYCSLTGYGQTGPYADRAGYDYIVQGMSGLMSVTGEPDGAPHKVGVAVVDLFTGMYAVNAVMAALFARERSGRGQYIDLALLDCAQAMLINVNMNYLVGGAVPQRLGNSHPNIVPYQVFKARGEGYFILCCGNDGQFRRVAEVLGHIEWASDIRFASNAARVNHRDVLTNLMAPLFLAQARDEWLQRFEQAGVSCGPINTVEQAFADPQIVARGMRFDMAASDGTVLPQVASPMRLSETPVAYTLPPPLLGEHTDAVLERLGVDATQRQYLRDDGII